MPFIYQADLYCDDCGRDIRKRLKAEGHAPEDPSDERSYDSDEYPKHVPDGGESDSPNHCGSGDDCLNAIELSDGSKIGALITEELTSDGEEYVRQAIAEGGLCAVEVWAEEWSDLKPDEPEEDEEESDEIGDHDDCPKCGTPSTPGEGVPDQALRGCPNCGETWFEDPEQAPRKGAWRPEDEPGENDEPGNGERYCGRFATSPKPGDYDLARKEFDQGPPCG